MSWMRKELTLNAFSVRERCHHGLPGGPAQSCASADSLGGYSRSGWRCGIASPLLSPTRALGRSRCWSLLAAAYSSRLSERTQARQASPSTAAFVRISKGGRFIELISGWRSGAGDCGGIPARRIGTDTRRGRRRRLRAAAGTAARRRRCRAPLIVSQVRHVAVAAIPIAAGLSRSTALKDSVVALRNAAAAGFPDDLAVQTTGPAAFEELPERGARRWRAGSLSGLPPAPRSLPPGGRSSPAGPTAARGRPSGAG